VGTVLKCHLCLLLQRLHIPSTLSRALSSNRGYFAHLLLTTPHLMHIIFYCQSPTELVPTSNLRIFYRLLNNYSTPREIFNNSTRKIVFYRNSGFVHIFSFQSALNFVRWIKIKENLDTLRKKSICCHHRMTPNKSYLGRV
jgi:hypothetical protein